MNKITTVIFDLDNTLIDTERIKIYLYQIAEEFGYTNDEARAIYRQIRGKDGKVEFALERYRAGLAARLVEDGKGEAKHLDERLNELFIKVEHLIAEDQLILLPGAREMIEFCLKLGLQVKVVSLGVDAWQKKKIELCGLGDYFKRDDGEDKREGEVELICTENEQMGKGKIGVIRSLLTQNNINGKNIVLFNDKPDETVVILKEFPDLEVYVRRANNDIRYQDRDYEGLKQFGRRATVNAELNELAKIFKERISKEYEPNRESTNNK